MSRYVVAGSATTDGHAVNQAFKRKVTWVGEACRQEGIAFILMAADTLGGWHTAAVEQVKKLGSALARQRGEDEQLEVRHLFQRISLLLQKGNSALLVNRTPEDDAPDATVDGIE